MQVNKSIFKLLCLLCILTGAQLSRAEEIEFTTEELPSESVMPVLDSPQAVRNRSLKFANRFDTRFSMGWLLDEPYYQNQFFSVQGTYHFNEMSGLGLKFDTWAQGLSDYSKQFESSTAQLEFGRSNGPQTGWGLDYEHRFFYGKVSFSKSYVVPISIYSDTELEMIKYGSRSLPMLATGIGHKIFFNQNLHVIFNIKVAFRQKVDPTSADLRGKDAAPSETDFKTTMKIGSIMDIAVGYLF